MATALNLVMVEDNEVLRGEIVDFLGGREWSVYGVDSGETLNEWLSDHVPHIAILDVNLPYEDGYSIAKRLRETYPNIGIVMLSARVRSVDRTEGYRSGADVYLTKPLHTQELIAVIEGLARKFVVRELPKYTLERNKKLLSCPQGKFCSLTSVESSLFELLALSPQRTAHKEFLADQISQRLGREITPQALAVYLSRLRIKCKEDLALNNPITADRGIGYSLTIPLVFQ